MLWSLSGRLFSVSEYSRLLLLCAFLLCYHLTTLGKRWSIHTFVQSHWSILPLTMSRKGQNGSGYTALHYTSLAVLLVFFFMLSSKTSRQ
nr:hypothetical protein Iba_chr15bCG4700 [Ipomoea batatas]